MMAGGGGGGVAYGGACLCPLCVTAAAAVTAVTRTCAVTWSCAPITATTRVPKSSLPRRMMRSSGLGPAASVLVTGSAARSFSRAASVSAILRPAPAGTGGEDQVSREGGVGGWRRGSVTCGQNVAGMGEDGREGGGGGGGGDACTCAV